MKKIGIIGAMELEVETLKAHMTTTKITTKAPSISAQSP